MVTSEKIRNKIEAYFDINFSVSKIYDILLENYPDECPHINTLYNLQNLYKKQGNLKPNLISNVGRKQTYNEREQADILNQFKENPRMSLRESACNKEVNPKSVNFKAVSNVLHENDLHAWKRPSKIILTEKQMQDRFDFAKDCSKWKQKQKTIAFSDESILVASKIGNHFVWAYCRDEIKDSECFQKKASSIKIHVFGIVSYQGPIIIKRITGSLNSDNYITLLEKSLKIRGNQLLRIRSQMASERSRFKCNQAYLGDNLKRNRKKIR